MQFPGRKSPGVCAPPAGRCHRRGRSGLWPPARCAVCPGNAKSRLGFNSGRALCCWRAHSLSWFSRLGQLGTVEVKRRAWKDSADSGLTIYTAAWTMVLQFFVLLVFQARPLACSKNRHFSSQICQVFHIRSFLSRLVFICTCLRKTRINKECILQPKLQEISEYF